MSSIEWTDETWNPIVGCSRVSPGCKNCYAIGIAHRAIQPAHVGLTTKRHGQIDWTGEVRVLRERLETPMGWRKPRRVFVGSMTDIFHKNVPTEALASIWLTMILAPSHQFQILTKRPGRMRQVLEGRVFHDWITETHQDLASCLPPDEVPKLSYPPGNVWLGTSIESDAYRPRADYLRAVPAAVRFLSLEPLLGPLPSLDLEGIDWVIVGAESKGPRVGRPCQLDWVREIRDQCQAAGVKLFAKQFNIGGKLVKNVDDFPADLQIREMP